jgi:DNA-binding MarR family transcriptional regulator
MWKKTDTDGKYRLWLSLMLTSDIVHYARDKELSQYGFSARQASVLFTIHTLGNDATVGNISKWLFRKPQTITGILSRMEKQGLIKKRRDSRRRSVVKVKITKKGQEAYSLSTKRTSIKNIMSILSEKEARYLRKCLTKLRKNALEELMGNPEDVFNSILL